MTKNKFSSKLVARILHEADAVEKTLTQLYIGKWITSINYYAWQIKYTTAFTLDTNGFDPGVNEGGALTNMSYAKENQLVSYADGPGARAFVYNGNG